jgi:hypothetical protein
MARRIIALSDLGLGGSPRRILAGIDLTKIQLTTFGEPWKFKHDPADEGTGARWFDPALSDSQWAPIRTDQQMGWDKQGFARGSGFGWYRATLPANKKDLSGKFRYLYFDAVDEEAWVYINGRKVFEHTLVSTNLLAEEIWTTPFSVPLAEVELGGNDLLAVRVYSKEAMAGIYKPVHLIQSDQPLTEAHLHAVRKLGAQK